MKSLSKLRKLLVASGGRHAHVIQRSGPSATYYYINSRQTGQVSCCLSFLTAVEEARSSAAWSDAGGQWPVVPTQMHELEVALADIVGSGTLQGKTSALVGKPKQAWTRTWSVDDALSWYTVFHYSSPLAVAAMYCRLCTSSRSLCSQVTRRREPSIPLLVFPAHDHHQLHTACEQEGCGQL